MGTTRRITRVSLALLAVAVIAPACATATADDPPDAGAADPDATQAAKRRIVILMIGDGMGRPQIRAASLKATGAPGGLYMQSLPYLGSIRTGSLSGITDSAAAATAMACGIKTLNGRIGVDAENRPVENLVERAHGLGMAAGVVTTTSLSHATPAAFTAHRASRHAYDDIAADQALLVQPEVMLGGGRQYFTELIGPLRAAGYHIVNDAAELSAAQPPSGARLFGSFTDDHMTYAIDRGVDSTEPTLAEMSLAAIRHLDRNERGFFLLIEGGRIDHAGHANDLARNIGETLAFDDAVAAVHGWQQASNDDVTLIITADHECGGLTIEQPPAKLGDMPQVSWRWGDHTNARVDAFASGAGAALLDGRTIDFTLLHAFMVAQLEGVSVVEPRRVLTPDGSFNDLRYRVVDQTTETGFGVGFNQLDSLYVDADETGLGLGVEGVFEWSANALVILVDIDYGAGTGLTRFAPNVSDTNGRVDSILSSLGVDASTHPGYGAEFAIVVWGGRDPHREDLIDDAGLRRLSPLDDLPWLGVATNFGEGVRVHGAALTSVAGEGFETLIPWSVLFGSEIPTGATIGVTVLLVNDDGGYASNQALPPFAAGTTSPGREVFALPGVAVIPVDANGDGVVDAELTPYVMP